MGKRETKLLIFKSIFAFVVAVVCCFFVIVFVFVVVFVFLLLLLLLLLLFMLLLELWLCEAGNASFLRKLWFWIFYKTIDPQKLEIQGGGCLGFWSNSFKGLLGVVRRSLTFFIFFRVLLHFYVTIFRTQWRIWSPKASHFTTWPRLRKFGNYTWVSLLWSQFMLSFSYYYQFPNDNPFCIF